MKMRHALAGTVALPLALAVAGAAQANVTIYESDTTEVYNYGRIQLQLENVDGDNTIQDGYSRLGFGSTSQIEGGMEAFTNVEFRFNPGADANTGVGAGGIITNIRSSFVGVRGDFGQVTVGNYNSPIYTNVTSGADIFYSRNGVASLINGAGDNAFGFGIAYQTTDLNGLQAGFSLKHFNDNAAPGLNPSDDGGEEWNLQAWAKYALNENLNFAFGFDQNNGDANGGSDEIILSAAVNYSLDDIKASFIFEMEDDDMALHFVGSYQLTEANKAYGSLTFMDDGDDNGIDLRVGADHRMSKNFVTFGEVAVGNDDVSAIGDIVVVSLGARYHW